MEALSIIADEVRAQLAETEKVATVAHAKAAEDGKATDEAESEPSADEGRATVRCTSAPRRARQATLENRTMMPA